MNIEFANQQASLVYDEGLLRRAIESVALEAGYQAGDISVAVVTDQEIHRLNRRHLNHDYTTDVLSFVFEREEGRLEGEIIVSADTAISTARELDWPAEHELLLYVVHGMLHLVGYDDKSAAAREDMRCAERRVLDRFGMKLPSENAAQSQAEP